MGANKTRLLLAGGAIVLSVLLFIAPKIAPENPEKENNAGMGVVNTLSTDATLEVYENMAQKGLEPTLKRNLDKLLGLKKYDSVAVLWDRLKRPDLAAFYVEEQAKINPTATNWVKAGSRYYYSVQFCKDKTEIPVLYQCAMRCFKNGLAIEPGNTDAKIMLGACYVEGSEDPMQGISILREVEKTDSNNVKLQLTFAFFSVKSGQLDKAIKRFNKVLEIDSNYVEAYLHLADAYEQQGNTAKTIAVLEKYAEKTPDVTARLEVNRYIEQLKEK